MFGDCKKLLPAGAMTLALAAPVVGHADAAKNPGAAGRALTFLENGPHGVGVLDVVCDRDEWSAQCKGEA